MTVFESPVISLGDLAIALEAAAEAFNARGGANGSCIEVHTCDDGANVDQSVECVREARRGGGRRDHQRHHDRRQGGGVGGHGRSRHPSHRDERVAQRLGRRERLPLDASGTGSTFLIPQALMEEDVKKIGVIRVDLAQASALKGILESLYKDDGATFP